MSILIGSPHSFGISGKLVRAFYAQHWVRPIALIDESFYKWQFESLPGEGKDNCVIAYDSTADAIAGVMGLNARPFFLMGKALSGAELTTWVVAEKYRAVGAGFKMLTYIQNSYEVAVGMGISASALPLYLRCDYRYLAGIPRFVRIFNLQALAGVMEVTPLTKLLAKTWLHKTPKSPYQVSEGPNSENDILFNRLSTHFSLFSRSTDYLKWRYIDHPLFKYRLFWVRPTSGEGLALVVMRKETAVPGITIYHITDCIGDESAMAAAFSFIDEFCMQEGADVADFYCTASKIGKYPLGGGWFSTLDDKFLAFPHLFHPVEVRIPATTSLIYWSKHHMTEMADFSRLYITKADADFDRPVLKTP